MTVSIGEKAVSRPQKVGADEQIELQLWALGDEDDAVIRAAVEDYISAYYLSLVFQSYSLTPAGAGFWDVSVLYGRRAPLMADVAGNAPSPIPPGQNGTPAQETNFAYSFDTTGGTQKITQSLQTMARLEATTNNTLPCPNFKGAIGVTGDHVEGCDVHVPALTFTVKRRFPASFLTLDYVRVLYTLTATVNNATWKGYPAGELLFLGASGGQRGSLLEMLAGRGEPPEIDFKFAASPNVVNRKIGEVFVPLKRGWEYLWVLYEDSVDTIAARLIKRPKAVYVEKVYENSDFRLLGLGS